METCAAICLERDTQVQPCDLDPRKPALTAPNTQSCNRIIGWPVRKCGKMDNDTRTQACKFSLRVEASEEQESRAGEP